MKLRVIEYDTVSSTNDLARDFARRGAREGLIIRSEYQTKGRGRGRHSWRSPRGKSVLMTLLLRPQVEAAKLSHLTVITCKSIAEFLRMHIEGVVLKLPNDILVSGKKIAGVLVEGETKGRMQKWVCVGIGMNVLTNKESIHRGGTSIFIEIRKKLDAYSCISGILSRLVKNYVNSSIISKNIL